MLFTRLLFVVVVSAGLGLISGQAKAFSEDAFQSVVSVLPVWPGHQQGGTNNRRGQAPEGSGVVLRDNIIATAWHVVEPATRIDVRLADGRILPAELIGSDEASDIALLRVDTALPPFALGPAPELAQPVCSIGNVFGLGLSVSCGVVSRLRVNNAGFNAVEDFIQTDAAANPGASGGALVDDEGRLVGMMSAIFASSADTNIGVNFAVSAALLLRVTDALLADGKVEYPEAGWQLAAAGRDQLARIAAPVIASQANKGPAERSGFKVGDLILDIGDRRIVTPLDAVSALAVLPQNQAQVNVRFQREGQEQVIALSFAGPAPSALESPARTANTNSDCPHPGVVCRMRQAVFPVSSYDPVGSATRIAPDLLVTNRHVVGDFGTATVHTPAGPLEAKVVPFAYRGDLVLLQVDGLPESGVVPEFDARLNVADTFYAVGADIARKEVRVFDPGDLIAEPAENGRFPRLHVTAKMQPGVSGGGVFDSDGELAGIAVGGGDGRFEAIPISDVQKLLDQRTDPEAASVTSALGTAFVSCAQTMEAIDAVPVDEDSLNAVSDTCSRGGNHGQLLEAGRILARSGDFDGAIRLHGEAAWQVPNSINTRMSLLVSLQLGGRFAEMTSHARRLIELAPNDPQALRFSIQSGVWGGDPDLAEDGYQALLKADPRQAQAARRFIDAAPPAPPRR